MARPAAYQRRAALPRLPPRLAFERRYRLYGLCSHTIERAAGIIASKDEGTALRVDFDSRYGDLTDEYEQMFSAEAAPPDTAVIVCGPYMTNLLAEMVRYLITPN